MTVSLIGNIYARMHTCMYSIVCRACNFRDVVDGTTGGTSEYMIVVMMYRVKFRMKRNRTRVPSIYIHRYRCQARTCQFETKYRVMLPDTYVTRLPDVVGFYQESG